MFHLIYVSQYFGLKTEQAPLIIIMVNEGEKYLNTHVEPDVLASWLKDYKVLFMLNRETWSVKIHIVDQT